MSVGGCCSWSTQQLDTFAKVHVSALTHWRYHWMVVKGVKEGELLCASLHTWQVSHTMVLLLRYPT